MTGIRIMSAVGVVIRVLVVDDHAPFRAAVGVLCMADGGLSVVAEAASVAGALAAAGSDDDGPDLVVLDVNLGLADGGLDGTQGARLLVERRPGLPVVLCSTAAPAELPPVPRSPSVTFVPKQNLDADVLRAWYEHCTSAGTAP